MLFQESIGVFDRSSSQRLVVSSSLSLPITSTCFTEICFMAWMTRGGCGGEEEEDGCTSLVQDDVVESSVLKQIQLVS